MDLSRWSVSQLIREARRLGVSRAESMSRSELMGAIKKAGRAPRDSLEAARSFLGGVVDKARAALGGRPSERAGPNKAPSMARPTQPATAPQLGRLEPVETRTMARLLSEQGHHRRAMAIYDKLLIAAPTDPVLAEEAQEVRARLSTDERGNARARGDEDDGEVVSLAVDATSVLVSWSVKDRAVARARRLLGGPEGKLAARLMVVAPDETRVVSARTFERTDIDATGEWVVRDLPQDTRATAAVGLLEGDRFVSIAHAPVVRPSPSA